MIDKAKISQAVKEMTANPDWADVLFDAPGGAQLRIMLAFYASKNLDSMNQQEKDEYREFREMLESQLNAEELKYLTEAFGRMGVDAAQSHYQELLSKKQPEGAAPQPTETQQQPAQDEAPEVRNLKHLLRTGAISKKDFSSGLAALAARGKMGRSQIQRLKQQMFVFDEGEESLGDDSQSEEQGE